MSNVASSSHIVTIRREGVIEGYQLRVNGGGPGLSKFFAVKKLGGDAKALKAARKFARDNNLPPTKARGGSPEGRPMRTTQVEPGIRFVWAQTVAGQVLQVHATWRLPNGTPRHTHYSVQRNGVNGALDRAIEARMSCGAPQPDRRKLLAALRKMVRDAEEKAPA